MKVRFRRPPKPASTRVRDRGQAWLKVANEAAEEATLRAGRGALDETRGVMRGAGLGRLGFAVGMKAKKTHPKKGRRDGAWSVLYLRDGPDSRSAGAIESYSQGSVITARRGKWLAFQTRAVQRRVSRYRMTPARYMASGLAQTLGPLHFRQVSPTVAVLVARKVQVRRKDGRAFPDGKRLSKTRERADEVVVFVLIRRTARAQRYDQGAIMRGWQARMGPIALDLMTSRLGRGI